MSGGKGPVIPFLSQDREAGGAKVITGLIKVQEEVKTLREVMYVFTWNF